MIKGIRDVHPLAALWLLADNYDYNDDPRHISATALLKPIRSSALLAQNPDLQRTMHITDFTASRLGGAVHDSIEQAWLRGDEGLLKRIGCEDIVVNPSISQEPLNEIHLEKRTTRHVNGYAISGKFDAVYRGQVTDIKSTKVYTYTSGSSDEDYIRQMSIYRWLNPDIIVKDRGAIVYLFKDWVARDVDRIKGYPSAPVVHKEFQLWTPEATEAWISNRLHQLDQLVTDPNAVLPECSDEELWRDPTVYKYYAKGDPTAPRSTRTFTDHQEAMTYVSTKGTTKGLLVPVPGKAKRCIYCPAMAVCTQASKMLKTGELVDPAVEKLKLLAI